jgi:hypothetical protein
MTKDKESTFDLTSVLNKMNSHHKELIKEIKTYCKDEGKVGKLCRHLLETKRNPYSIINDTGFSAESPESMLCLFDRIHNAFSDDGEMNLFYVNGEPRISFLDRYEHKISDFLNHTENHMANVLSTTKYPIKYDVVFVKYWEDYVVEKWIHDSIAREAIQNV